MAWSSSGIELTELLVIAENREVFRVLLGLLPPQPSTVY